MSGGERPVRFSGSSKVEATFWPTTHPMKGSPMNEPQEERQTGAENDKLEALRAAILAIPEYADGGDDSTPIRLAGSDPRQTIYHDYYVDALEAVVGRAAELVGL